MKLIEKWDEPYDEFNHCKRQGFAFPGGVFWTVNKTGPGRFYDGVKQRDEFVLKLFNDRIILSYNGFRMATFIDIGEVKLYKAQHEPNAGKWRLDIQLFSLNLGVVL